MGEIIVVKIRVELTKKIQLSWALTLVEIFKKDTRGKTSRYW